MNYKLGSLFDGSGGFPLAGALCGIEPMWAAEVEPYPIAVTRSRFPNMKHLGDISKVSGAEIEPVDIITFGSPCQDLSVAGKRAGLKHTENGDEETTRSGLFMEAVRIIKEMRRATNGEYPRYALWENVPGAFSSNNGEDFRIVCEELIKIIEPGASMPSVPKNGWNYADSFVGDGWSLAYRVLDAQYWGVPQRRRRIYLVADFRGESAREVLFEREGLRGYFTQGRTPWQTTPAHAEGSPGADDRQGESRRGDGGRGLDAVDPTVIIDSIGGQAERGWEGDKAPTLKATHYKSPPSIVVPDRCFAVENHPADSRVSIDESGKCQTLTSRMGTGGGNVPMVMEPKLFENHGQDVRFNGPLDVAPTAQAGYGEGGSTKPLVVECAIPIHDQATRFSGKRGNKTDGKGNGLGVGEPGDPMNTLTGGDRHAVAYGLDRATFNQGQNAKFDFSVMEEQQPTLVARGPGAVCYGIDHAITTGGNCTAQGSCIYEEIEGTLKASGAHAVAYSMKSIARNGTPLVEQANPICASDYKDPDIVAAPPNYIVRRLTPTECARLQGFADRWGDIDAVDKFTQKDYQFWLEVRNTHARINGRPEKAYTVKQMLTWYNKLQTDSAEYKMWGNGIALPTAPYCVQGIADALEKATTEAQEVIIEDDDDWMN